MKLNQVRHAKRGPKLGQWCGPTALSIITGRTIDHCAKLCAEKANDIRIRNDGWGWRDLKRKHTAATIKGTYAREVLYALHKMGYRETRVELPIPRESLLRYMRGRGGAEWKSVMLVVAGNHWLVLHKDTIADSYRPNGVHYEEHPKRYCKLRYARRIKKA